MAILDIFKKQDKPKKETKPVEKKTAPKEKPVAAVQAQKKTGKIIPGIVKYPHISEKATNLGEQDQYIFEVFPKANKNQIKKAIEGIYGVDVLSVNIVNIHRKARRLGRTAGFKSGYKKAIIKIKSGQKIEIL